MKLTPRQIQIAAAAAGVIVIVALWFTIGPGRGPKLSTERLTPLASELEGIRGVYLYFGVPGSDDLAAEYRDVVVKDREADRVRAIYRELLSGSTGSYESPFPDGVELLNAYYTSRGNLYLDWNQALVKEFQGGSGRERQLLASIVLTAADNLPDVSEVTILVEGNPVGTIGGHFDVMMPLGVDEWR
jgi:sporulation and spore germination protein